VLRLSSALNTRMNRFAHPLHWLVVVPVLLGVAGACRHRAPVVPRDPSLAVPGIWPVDHPSRTITSPFGERTDPRRFRSRRRFHTGVDIAAPKGSPVVATGDGVVCHAGRVSGYGRVVRIDHGNGYVTVYAHLAEIRTRMGRRVMRGDVIGSVGKSGHATGPHVHYEVHNRGRRVDPKSYLPH
jgi:murein DD-endopeptidase MepM/ murein hydrolase activator NlpD